MGSNPSRVIPLLGIAHSVKRLLFQVQEAIGKAALIRGRFEKKAGLWLWYFHCITCIKTLNFDICFG